MLIPPKSLHCLHGTSKEDKMHHISLPYLNTLYCSVLFFSHSITHTAKSTAIFFSGLHL